MSGGAYDYFFSKIEDYAKEVRIDNCPYRQSFVNLLNKVAEAAYKIEWVDSGDCGEGDEIKAIIECLGDNADLKIKSDAYDKIRDMVEKMEKTNEQNKRN